MIKRQNFFYLLISILILQSCGSLRNIDSNIELNFLDEYEIPFNQTFLDTKIGGLSGIDYFNKNVYFLISDDRSVYNPSRYYTTRIKLKNNKIDSVTFLSVKFLRNVNGSTYKSSEEFTTELADPEDIRYNPNDNFLYWSNEGERLINNSKHILQTPTIYTIDLEGNYIDKFKMPFNLIMQSTKKGPRRNGTLEGITFSQDYNYLYASLEEPLYEDGNPSDTKEGGVSRIYKFNTKTKEAIEQYAYPLDPVAYEATPKGSLQINGISAILELKKNKLLIVERSYSNGRNPCTIKIFFADLEKATNVSPMTSLKEKEKYKMISKKLLLNLDTLGVYTDNIEGITFGPNLSNGNKTLLLVGDNNFSEKQKNQILLFKLLE